MRFYLSPLTKPNLIIYEVYRTHVYPNTDGDSLHYFTFQDKDVLEFILILICQKAIAFFYELSYPQKSYRHYLFW